MNDEHESETVEEKLEFLSTMCRLNSELNNMITKQASKMVKSMIWQNDRVDAITEAIHDIQFKLGLPLFDFPELDLREAADDTTR